MEPEIPKSLAELFARASTPALQGNHHPPASGYDANTVQAFASGFAAAVRELSGGRQDPAQLGQQLRERAGQLMEMADLYDLVQASLTKPPPEPGTASPNAAETVPVAAPATEPAAVAPSGPNA